MYVQNKTLDVKMNGNKIEELKEKWRRKRRGKRKKMREKKTEQEVSMNQ